MNRSRLEKLYEVNGLKDYEIMTPDDLLKIHGIDYQQVAGYSGLDDVNRQLYAKFIVNFFNSLGLESRATLIPKGIYFVEEIEFMAKKHPKDKYFELVGGVVNNIDKNRIKTVHQKWQDEDYQHLNAIECDPQTYLRFEYEHNGEDKWLHVMGERNWY